MDNSPIIIQQQPDGSNNKMEDCISGGRYYLHGTTWHPVMGPFGPMDCVNCQCRSGRIECQRLECPSRPALNCERPVKVAGRCCPVCPLIEGDIQGTSGTSEIRSGLHFGDAPQQRPQNVLTTILSRSILPRSVVSLSLIPRPAPYVSRRAIQGR